MPPRAPGREGWAARAPATALSPVCASLAGQLAAGTCEIVTLDRDSSQPRRTIARQTARCACRKGQIAGTTRARPACVDGKSAQARPLRRPRRCAPPEPAQPPRRPWRPPAGRVGPQAGRSQWVLGPRMVVACLCAWSSGCCGGQGATGLGGGRSPSVAPCAEGSGAQRPGMPSPPSRAVPGRGRQQGLGSSCCMRGGPAAP